VVQASDFDIKVLGTTFNVKSYSDEPTAEALLVEGSIEMTSKGQREKFCGHQAESKNHDL
jgi:ferric-dicitrate binding protein FerR (iron transport regulator)